MTTEGEFRIPVFIVIEPDRVSLVGVRMTREDRLKLYQGMVEQGLRAQLGTVSLVTGQLYVQLDFHPGTPVRLVGTDSDIPELPTIPTTLQQASQAAQELLERIGQLPLDQLLADVLGITQGLNRLVNAPEVFTLIRSLEGTSVTVQQLVQRVDGDIGRLLDELGGTSSTARAMMTDLQQLARQVHARVGPLADSAKDTLDVARATLKDGQQLVRHVDGRVGRLTDTLVDTNKVAQTTLVRTQRTLDSELSHTLQEMTAAMRAIRLLADYLERNPNALVYGKGGDRR
jgi:paraquat-inducible protein B